MWGWPYFGVGKLTLIFDKKAAYVIWMLFITPWISMGIHTNFKQ
jgi:hypothetical protein